MAVTTAQDIVDQARILLQDIETGGTRWLDDEMLTWVNAGQREVAVYKPDCSITTEAVILVVGTKQTLPATAIMLNKISRNMGTNGTTPGNAIRIVDQEIMDSQAPDWHSAAASAVIKHYMYDKSDPLVFYVTPPQPASGFGYVEMSYPAVPGTIAGIGDAIKILDIYSNALVNYIMYRALLKDATYTKDSPNADIYYTAFLRSIGILAANKSINDPNRDVGNPNAVLSAAPDGA